MKSLHRKNIKIIGTNKNSDSYPRCNLCKNGTHKALKIHQFIALCFIPNSQNKLLGVVGKLKVNDRRGKKHNVKETIS